EICHLQKSARDHTGFDMMGVRLWGVRSQIPRPLTTAAYQARLEELLASFVQAGSDAVAPGSWLREQSPALNRLIGGNTACISVQLGDDILILEAGTGLYDLGQHICQQNKHAHQPTRIHICLSHIHRDRIQGLPDFAPLYQSGYQIHFYYPEPNLELRLVRLQSPPYFEAALDAVAADVRFHTLQDLDGSYPRFATDHWQLQCCPLIHPGGSYAWRIQGAKSSLVYAGAGKIGANHLQSDGRGAAFFADADLLFLDARPELNSQNPLSWGHYTYEQALETAVQCNARHLFLFNHGPDDSDAKLWTAWQALTTDQGNKKPQVHLAREGMEIAARPA
ncbi:MAG: hypothetical protein KDK39_05640, partial [Leptospiraceae bacterium]|nr:hypothetical protein [Leptospiraceae bacterium]